MAGSPLFGNMDGDRNTATGYAALSSQASGSANTATGYAALLNSFDGSFNTAIGNDAGANVCAAR